MPAPFLFVRLERDAAPPSAVDRRAWIPNIENNPMQRKRASDPQHLPLHCKFIKSLFNSMVYIENVI
jgi:hypothetical protein